MMIFLSSMVAVAFFVTTFTYSFTPGSPPVRRRGADY